MTKQRFAIVFECWVDQNRHLPDSIRKNAEAINSILKDELERNNTTINPESPMDTLNAYLKIIAAYGYTLQKSRANVDFLELMDTIEEKNNETFEALAALAKDIEAKHVTYPVFQK